MASDVIQQTSKKLQQFIRQHVDDNLGITNEFLNHLTLQVTELLARCRGIRAPRRFVTLCAQNELDAPLARKIRKMPHASIIVNLDDGVGVSGHFVAILFTSTETMYMDSMARSLTNHSLIRFIQSMGRERVIVENQSQIQAASSKFCGLFALSFVAVFEAGLDPISTLLWHYPRHLHQNDTLCAKYITHLFSECKRQKKKFQ